MSAMTAPGQVSATRAVTSTGGKIYAKVPSALVEFPEVVLMTESDIVQGLGSIAAGGAAAHYIAAAARWIVGLVLSLAGVAKLRSPGSLSRALPSLAGVPHKLIGPVALLLPGLELILGIMLLVGLGSSIAGAASAALFALFTVVIGLNIASGRHVECSCFGNATSQRMGGATVIRNTLLLLLSLAVTTIASPYLTIDTLAIQYAVSTPPAADGIPVALLSLGTIVAYIAVATIISQGRLASQGQGRP
jgi:uncharacterized membrane protein YphA (DoxX/SURF4 family)